MRKVVHYAGLLGAICAGAAFSLAGTFHVTHNVILAKEQQERARAQGEALGGAAGALRLEPLNPAAPEAERVMVARDSADAVAGYTGAGEAQGYGGKVRVIVGLDGRARTIRGLKVIAQSETPGLGTRIAEVKSGRTWLSLVRGGEKAPEDRVPVFLKQFHGLSLEQVRLKSGAGAGVQAITGATVSSRAAVNAVRDAMTRIQAAANKGR